MFKNAIVYRFEPGWAPTLESMEDALSNMLFEPCGPTQEKSSGWVPPRGEQHGALVESINGHRILCFNIESKAVPGPVVKRKLGELVSEIETKEGRKPGRKESRELRDEIVRDLLPMAFARSASVWVWIDLQNGFMVLDCGSQSRADDVITAMIKCFDGLTLSPLNTQITPQAAMTQWLGADKEEWPAHFAPGREVELKSGDEMNSVVKFTRHHLDDEEMRRHIGQGKLPTKLALDWDGRVAFILTESTQLKRIAFLDGVFEDNATADDNGGFDADMAIVTGELSAMIADLITALGGELQ